MRRLHVVPHEGHWEIRHENDPDAVSVHATRADAEKEAGRHVAAHGDIEVVIHDDHDDDDPIRIRVD
ncbi:MAG: hypothetical protein QOD55_1125 [Solirubrobacteraceae bacterium]|jgi:hypothetical protein|nr:hypothetical protein [Solirubrobacteraceae bacterium]